ncbi:MAG: prepilin-type N-terminal cleavage/methylation domain-containing protein [Acidobacteriota bacterium]|jgi:general secretion pathway protein J|nr:prepilin-type N-terminal cleavage/methylation domain-containing protein [Acidobacteriota bacterium]
METKATAGGMRRKAGAPACVRAVGERGFTLLELLVAVTLVALMVVGIWTALTICINSWVRGVETIDINQRDRNTMDMVRKQIASAYPLVPNSVTYSPATNTATMSSTPPIVFRGAAASLQFVSPNSLMSLEGAGLMMVAYEVEEDSDGNTALMAKEARYTGQSVGSAGFTSSVPVFFNLEECLFEYYDPGDADEPAAWATEWDTGVKQRLPAAVRLSMVAKETGFGSRTRQLVIPMRAQADVGTMSLRPSNGRRRRVGRPTEGRVPGGAE